MPGLRFLSWASCRGRGAAWHVCLSVLALLALPPAHAADRYAIGNDHYFNREFEEAVQWFGELVEDEPEDPTARFLLGKALFYRELHRLGMVGTSAFGHDREYNKFVKPKPDPKTGTLIRETLEKGRLLCEQRLQTRPEDKEALYTLARVLAVRSGFEFMVRKAYFKALGTGRAARAVSYRVGKFHPDFVDGLLVAGLDEYILGSLPWAVRTLIALSGYRGNRRKGEAIIAHVASEGTVSRDEARVLYALVHRKERRYAEAAAAFHSLATDFPRAYTFALEAAAMHVAAGEKGKAVKVFREVERKRSAREDTYDRMPSRVAAALSRRIEDLGRELRTD